MNEVFAELNYSPLRAFAHEATKVTQGGQGTYKEKLRKWVWEHTATGIPAAARETQALRLMHFIETRSFDADT